VSIDFSSYRRINIPARRVFEWVWRKSREYQGLGGLRRIGETVEMCGKVKFATSADRGRFLRRLLVGGESVDLRERDNQASDGGGGGVLDKYA
jgi:hypothetical protein